MTMAAVTPRTSTVPRRLSRMRCCQLLGALGVLTGLMASLPLVASWRLVVPLLRVAVQAAEEEVAEEGEQHTGERCYEQPCRARSYPAAGHPGVQVGAVDEPGEQRGRLLGVPAPVGAPGDLRPDRAQNDDQGEQREADDDSAVSQLVQDCRLGQSAPAFFGLDQVEASRGKGDRERAVGDDRHS